MINCNKVSEHKYRFAGNCVSTWSEMSLRDLLEPDCGGSNPLLSMSARMASATPEARVRVLDQSGVSSEGAERSATIPPLFSNLIEIEKCENKLYNYAFFLLH